MRPAAGTEHVPSRRNGQWKSTMHARVHGMRSIGIAEMIGAIVQGGCARTSAPAHSQTLEQLARTSLARIEGRSALPGLKADVEVLRDEWGVPHIYAKDMDDLFFAQGFVVAQDRLWQMELWRRTAEGRVAELVGPAGAPARPADSAVPVPRTRTTRRSGSGITRRAAASSRPTPPASTRSSRGRRDPAGGVHAHRHAARAVDAPSSSFSARA